MFYTGLVNAFSYYHSYNSTFSNQHFFNMGDYVFGISAKQIAMGTVMGLNENGAFNLAYNPSTLMLADDIRFNSTIEFLNVSEAVETFDASYEEPDWQNNTFDVWDYKNVGLLLPVTKDVIIGAGYYRYIDLNYQNTVLVYDSDNVRTGVWEREKEGSINKIPLGGAINIEDVVSIGGSFNILTGEEDALVRQNSYSNTNESYHKRNSDYSANNLNIGISIYVFKNLKIGAYFETAPSFEVEDNLTLVNERTNLVYYGTMIRSVSYPQIIGVNVLFKADDFYDSTFLLDVVIKDYKSCKQKITSYKGGFFSQTSGLGYLQSVTNTYSYQKEKSLSDFYASLRSIIEISIGVEHIFPINRKLKFPVRYGFLHKPSPYEKDSALTAISLGTGLKARLAKKVKGEIDFGYLYGTRDSIDYKEGAYPEFISGDTSSLRKIKESFHLFMITVGLRY